MATWNVFVVVVVVVVDVVGVVVVDDIVAVVDPLSSRTGVEGKPIMVV